MIERIRDAGAEMIDRKRVLNCLEDTAIIKEVITIMYKQYQQMRADIVKQDKFLKYSFISISSYDVDSIKINQNEQTHFRAEFPTIWLSDLQWQEKARNQIQLMYEIEVMDILQK